MSNLDIAREEAMLAELAELDLALARRVHERAMAAEDDKAAAELARSYQRIARSLRQTLALKAKLKTERLRWASARPDAAAAPAAALEGELRARRREVEVREAVERVIFSEREGEAQDWALERLDDYLAEAAGGEDFAAGPLDEQVARVCAALGLPAEAARRWRELPDPWETAFEPPPGPAPPDPPAVHPQSSA